MQSEISPRCLPSSIQKNSAEVNETIDGFELLGLDSQSPQGMAVHSFLELLRIAIVDKTQPRCKLL